LVHSDLAHANRKRERFWIENHPADATSAIAERTEKHTLASRLPASVERTSPAVPRRRLEASSPSLNLGLDGRPTLPPGRAS
jgi:hypothetical protein